MVLVSVGESDVNKKAQGLMVALDEKSWLTKLGVGIWPKRFM